MFPYIKIGSLSIPMYGLMTALGVMVTFFLYRRRLKAYRYNIRILIVAALICMGCLAIGSKLLFFFTQIPSIVESFSWRNLLDTFITSGFVFYGGLIGAVFSVSITSKVLNINRQKLSNYLALGFPLFHAIGRLGCFFGGCCYGIPWKHGIAMAETPDIKRVPIQLIECAVELGIFFYLRYRENKGNADMQMAIYILIYSVCRFFLEFMRGDEIRGIWAFGLSTSQYISMILFIVSLVMILRNKTDAGSNCEMA